jgi:hypothetical protein
MILSLKDSQGVLRHLSVKDHYVEWGSLMSKPYINEIFEIIQHFNISTDLLSLHLKVEM